jgi:protein O-mannosyl-transferase
MIDTESGQRWVRWICLGIILGTLSVYWQAGTFEFINYDDDRYVSANPLVQRGLTSTGIAWGLTTGFMGHWVPVTWWSHMAACDLFGPNPGAHHLINVALHLLTSVLLFLVLNRLTASVWPSAVVAALFAWHPAHVESVAWIAERKDVLSGLCFVLTLGAYARYVGCRLETAHSIPQSSTLESQVSPNARNGWYCVTLVCFILGLMSKPMLVTVPFVMLLLDYWPLRRLELGGAFRMTGLKDLVREKLPFFGLAAVASWIALLAQKMSGGLNALGPLPFSEHLGTALVSYLWYIVKTLYPADLAVPYPYHGRWPLGQVAGAVLVLVLFLALVLKRGRRQPWAAMGLFWFIGMLVPVIGIVQVGRHTVADRYTYLPLIGLFIAGVWSAAEWVGVSRWRRGLAWVICTTALAGCLAGTWRQLGYWHDSLSLFGHALKVTENNAVAHCSYGQALHVRGRKEEAVNQYREALRINPNFPTALVNVAIIEYETGNLSEASNHLKQAVGLCPGYALAHYKLGQVLAGLRFYEDAEAQFALADVVEPGNALLHTAWGKVSLEQGRLDEAGAHFAVSVRGDPRAAEAHVFWGVALAAQGHLDAAADQVSQALRLEPTSSFAHTQMGLILSQQDRTSEAIREYQEALQLQPDSVEALNNLAWLLATHEDPAVRNGAEAVKYAERACELTKHQQSVLLGTLAAAYAEHGQFAEAIKMAQQAINLAEAAGQKDVASRNRDLLQSYRAGKPCREKF